MNTKSQLNEFMTEFRIEQIELFKQSICWEFRVKGTDIVDEVEGVREADGIVIGKNTGDHDAVQCEIIGGQDMDEVASKLMKRNAAKKPSIEKQIQFIRKDIRALESGLSILEGEELIKEQQDYEEEIAMLRAIEENLIAVKLYNKSQEVSNG